MKSAATPPSTRTFLIDGAVHAAPRLVPGLYVTATPIGNLGDITLRALRTLAAADLVACEDTRITSRLTRHFGIGAPLISYHEHNADRQRRVAEALGRGQAVVLVSDAGTPLISDPGYRLVADVVAAGHAVIPIPGPSAAVAALSAAGLPTDTFLFAGFLPPKTAARRKRLAVLAEIPATLVLYEAPQRTAETLADMAAVLGPRQAVVAREVTKAFETFRRDTLAALAEAFRSAPPRGEVTILVAPPEPDVADDDSLDAALQAALATESVSAAAASVAALLRLPRKKVYARALELRGGDR